MKPLSLDEFAEEIVAVVLQKNKVTMVLKTEGTHITVKFDKRKKGPPKQQRKRVNSGKGK